MFSTVQMSRITMAGPNSNLDEALRLSADLGNVKVKPYYGEMDGIKVGIHNPDDDEI